MTNAIGIVALALFYALALGVLGLASFVIGEMIATSVKDRRAEKRRKEESHEKLLRTLNGKRA